MAYRTLELTLLSAKDLKDVNVFSKMNVYTVASIAGDRRSQQRTPVDRVGGKSPSWNASFRFDVPAEPSAAARLALDILIRAERAFGDRDVGEVHVPLKDFLEGFDGGARFVSYQVRNPHANKARGVLNLSYKFVDFSGATSQSYPQPPSFPSEKPAVPVTPYPPPPSEKPPKASEPVMAYPASAASWPAYPPPYPSAGVSQPYPPQVAYPAYPPQQSGYGYGAPPPAGYGYAAPQPGGYGYGAAPPKKQNKFGMGLGAGLLGGALGGLLLGDVVSDAAAYDDGYDYGYDNGFDDGFDF